MTPRDESLKAALRTGAMVHLRFPFASDEAAYESLRAESGEFLTKWEPRPPDSDQSAFERLLETANTARSRRMVVVLNETAEIAGQVSLNEIIRGPLQQCFLGYWTGKRFARWGIMTEAIPLALQEAFFTLGLARVEANIQPHNQASIGLIEKLGFRREGYSPKYLQIDGERVDHVRYAMLAEEFADRFPSLAWKHPKT